MRDLVQKINECGYISWIFGDDLIHVESGGFGVNYKIDLDKLERNPDGVLKWILTNLQAKIMNWGVKNGVYQF